MPRERFRLPEWFDREEAVNPAALEALWTALQRLEPDTAVAMLYLRTAAGKHLDAHGVLYGVTRRNREADAPYRQRILAEVLNPRSSREAIEGIIEAAMPGVTATVVPPELSGDASLYFDGSWDFDGTEEFTSPWAGVELAIFDVIVEGEGVDLAAARALIERIRAAGYIPTVATLFTLDATIEPSEGISGTSQEMDSPRFNGFRTFDGSWTFGVSPTGDPQAL